MPEHIQRIVITINLLFMGTFAAFLAYSRMLEDLLHAMGIARHCLGITAVNLDDLGFQSKTRKPSPGPVTPLPSNRRRCHRT